MNDVQDAPSAKAPRTISRRQHRRRALWFVSGFSAVAALAAVLAETAPTAIEPWNALLRALFAVLVTVAASQARRWSLLVLTGIAAGASVVAAPWPVIVVAWVALGLAFYAAVVDMRRRWFLALTGALASVALLRLGDLGIDALSAVLAITAAIPACISAYRLQRRRRRRLIRRIAYGVAGAAGVAVVGFALAAAQAAEQVDIAISSSRNGVESARDGKDGEADRQLARSRDAFGDAKDLFAAWYALPARLVPVAGSQAAALDRLAVTGHGLAATAHEVATQADYRDVAMADGRIDVQQIASLEGPLRRVQDALRVAQGDVDDLRSVWLAPPIARRYDELAGEVRDAAGEADTALLGVQVAPDMLGANGPRRYFVAFTTPAESRAAGGFMGNWAEVTADHGKLELTKSGRSAEVRWAPGQPERQLLGPSDYVERYRFAQPHRDLRDATVSPNFPSVGAVYDASYPQTAVGSPVEGVIAIDPYALAAMLKLTGPIRLEGLDVPLSADNAVDVLLRRQYIEFADDNEERVDFLDEAADRTFDKFLELDGIEPARLTAVFGPVVEQRHLMAYSERPREQELFTRLGLDGAFPHPPGADVFGLTTQNAGNNKIDVFLHRSVRYDVRPDPANGTLRATATITLRNDAPSSGLPFYVIANNADRSVPDGTNSTWFTFFSPHRLTRATIDGRPLATGTQQELGLWAYDSRFPIPSGGTVTIVLELEGALRSIDRYQVDWYQQPMVNADDVSVDIEPVAPWAVAGSSTPGVRVHDGTAELERKDNRVDGSLAVDLGGR